MEASPNPRRTHAILPSGRTRTLFGTVAEPFRYCQFPVTDNVHRKSSYGTIVQVCRYAQRAQRNCVVTIDSFDQITKNRTGGSMANSLPLVGRQDMIFDIPGSPPLRGFKFTDDVKLPFPTNSAHGSPRTSEETGHGGIGFTWENDIHLYYRCAKLSETALGDASFHRECPAQLVVDAGAVSARNAQSKSKDKVTNV